MPGPEPLPDPYFDGPEPVLVPRAWRVTAGYVAGRWSVSRDTPAGLEHQRTGAGNVKSFRTHAGAFAHAEDMNATDHRNQAEVLRRLGL